jgi:hypothetical protein
MRNRQQKRSRSVKKDDTRQKRYFGGERRSEWGLCGSDNEKGLSALYRDAERKYLTRKHKIQLNLIINTD